MKKHGTVNIPGATSLSQGCLLTLNSECLPLSRPDTHTWASLTSRRVAHPAGDFPCSSGDLHFWYHRLMNECSGDGDFWGCTPPATVVFLGW